MRRILCTPTCLVLVLALLALPPTQQALSDEPPLPTDGIDDPAPGPLALPARITGPDGHDLLRSASLGIDGRDDGLVVTTGYGSATKDRPIWWNVQIRTFDRPGAAHDALHAILDPPRSSPLVYHWSKRWQRIHEGRGILLGRLREQRYAGAYIAVLRHSLVSVTPRRGTGWSEDGGLRVEDLAFAGKNLALRVLQLVEEAEPALRPIKAAFAQRVVVDHEFVQAEGRSRIVVRMTPGPGFGDGRVRFKVFAGSRGRQVYVTADTLGREPLAVIEFSKATDPGLKSPRDADATGATIRVFRVIEGDALAIEETRVVAGARGSQVVKSL